MLRRRLLLNQSRLPSEYQEVEWIGSSGTQYFITNVMTISSPFKFHFAFENQKTDRIDRSVFGQRTFGKMLNTYRGTYEIISGTIQNVDFLNQYIEIEFYLEDFYPRLKQNGNIIYTSSYLFTSPRTTGDEYGVPMFAFRENNINTPIWFWVGKIYFYKIYEGDNLSYDFIPCYRKSDNEIGMYDLVNGVFYTNQGTGTFTKGSDV